MKASVAYRSPSPCCFALPVKVVEIVAHYNRTQKEKATHWNASQLQQTRAVWLKLKTILIHWLMA